MHAPPRRRTAKTTAVDSRDGKVEAKLKLPRPRWDQVEAACSFAALSSKFLFWWCCSDGVLVVYNTDCDPCDALYVSETCPWVC